MKSSRILPVLFLTIGLAACGGDEAVKPDAPAAEAPKAAETSGIDQGGAQGNVTSDKSGTAGGGDDMGATDAKRRVHFAYDSDSVDDENRAVVEANADYMKANPNLKVNLQGHTDERGTREYNLALGERRAKAVARMLKVLGIPDNRIATTSYGEEKPMAMDQGEAAWKLNRRVEFLYK